MKSAFQKRLLKAQQQLDKKHANQGTLDRRLASTLKTNSIAPEFSPDKNRRKSVKVDEATAINNLNKMRKKFKAKSQQSLD